MKQLIAITPGEPAGIGPDIVLSAIPQLQSNNSRALVIADKNLLADRAEQLGLDINIIDFDGQHTDTQGLLCLHTPLAVPVKTGSTNPDNASYVLECLEKAVQGCQQQQYAAMVTGPVHKAVINDSGIKFSGHTEFLAELDQRQPVMMLATDAMRVALVTTHLPLHQVSQAITAIQLSNIIETLHTDLIHKFHIKQPRIMVLGLNPHSGEDGHLGNEEITIIIPTLEKLRAQGMQLTGPLPADTAFSADNLKHHDAVLAMYHDQGLPVLKYSGFGAAVNITLGLSFIRLSVDHGTALELAGTGKATHSSLVTAYQMAADMVHA